MWSSSLRYSHVSSSAITPALDGGRQTSAIVLAMESARKSRAGPLMRRADRQSGGARKTTTQGREWRRDATLERNRSGRTKTDVRHASNICRRMNVRRASKRMRSIENDTPKCTESILRFNFFSRRSVTAKKKIVELEMIKSTSY